MTTKAALAQDHDGSSRSKNLSKERASDAAAQNTGRSDESSTRHASETIDAPLNANEQGATLHDRSISRIFVADDGRSSYHGQTSALFEIQESSGKATSKRLPSNWVRKALLAEAAIQSR